MCKEEEEEEKKRKPSFFFPGVLGKQQLVSTISSVRKRNKKKRPCVYSFENE
jgi:hypothetical protein